MGGLCQMALQLRQSVAAGTALDFVRHLKTLMPAFVFCTFDVFAKAALELH
jgi:hypothetical protein